MEFILLNKEEYNRIIGKLDEIVNFISLLGSTENDEALNSQEAADYIGVTTRTLKNYRDDGLIKFSQLKPRGNITYKKSDLFQAKKTLKATK